VVPAAAQGDESAGTGGSIKKETATEAELLAAQGLRLWARHARRGDLGRTNWRRQSSGLGVVSTPRAVRCAQAPAATPEREARPSLPNGCHPVRFPGQFSLQHLRSFPRIFAASVSGSLTGSGRQLPRSQGAGSEKPYSGVGRPRPSDAGAHVRSLGCGILLELELCSSLIVG